MKKIVIPEKDKLIKGFLIEEEELAEHDAEIRTEVLKEIESAMYHQCFECDNDEDMQKWDGGNWFRYKLFENVIERVKGQKDERCMSCI